MRSLARAVLLTLPVLFLPPAGAGWTAPPTVAPTLPAAPAYVAEPAAARTPAERVTFAGRVTSVRTGDPVPSARVRLGRTGYGDLTDAAGDYAFDVPRERLAADLELVAARPGFRTGRAGLRPPPAGDADTVRTDFALREVSVALQEVVVTGVPGSAREAAAAAPAVAADAALRQRAAVGHWPGRRPDWNREGYAHIEENAFLSPESDPLSTFSIDVDRASYSNVRRFLLLEGRLPPVDAVQVEEMINYFAYDYALPDGDHPVAVTTELGAAPWREGHRLLRIGLASRPIDREALPPSNLVFLLDVSGSMRSPDKLPLVKRSMRLLVEQLRPRDRVAIVVYAGAAGLVLESTSGADKERILDAIGRLEAGGSTAGGAGLRLAYRVAREHFREGGNNRVVLATDGDFNVGPSSDSEMVRLIEEKREEGTHLTVLGFGTGNLQSGKMQGLAQHGNGNYAYIDSLDEARKVLVKEMGGTLLTVARDVKLQVEFNPARVRAYRLIGYENRLLADQDFNDDAKDAGDLGAGHRVTALYEIVPVGVASDVTVPGVDPLRYRDPAGVSDRAAGEETAFVRIRYKPPAGDESRLLEHPVRDRTGSPSADFRFASAVAGFGMLLRNSEHRGSVTASDVLSLAREGLGADPEGYRRSFLELVRAYRRIEGGEGGRDDGAGCAGR